MSWSGFANSIHSFFSSGYGSGLRSQPTDCTEEIREAMLHLLGDRINDIATAHLVKRLRLAADVQELWFARAPLMSALAVLYGETLARQKLVALNALFEGQIPASMAPAARRPQLHG